MVGKVVIPGSAASPSASPSGEPYRPPNALGAQTLYYRHDRVFDTDAELKTCLEWKGKWKPISKDSEENKEWDRAERRKRIEKLSDTITR